ncbi:LysR family transcriptional regulator [Marinibaculum pumilum]|uniref:LysR family transcriptional regulator n=1 Tax=Marinibaculum pumilum TaxID=1766165 RepID=A0ABV7L185_9PROT
MRIDPRQMEMFLAVYRSGSLGRASQQLNLTQPAVSKAIRRLERSLQVTLFEREPRGMVPTLYAEALVRHAELVSSELQRAVEEIAAMRGTARGRAKIGGTPSVIEGLFPAAISRLLGRRPALTVEVREALEGPLLEALLKGEIDLAVAGGMRRIRDYPVRVEALYVDRVQVVCRPDHPLRRAGGPPGLEDLQLYPWVLTERDNVMWRRLSEMFYDAGLDPPETAVETSSARLMTSVVRDSDFLTWLPEALVTEELRDGSLAVLAPERLSWERQVVAVQREKGSLPRPAAAFLETLRALCRSRAAAE